jgi:hypothetical protein
MDPAYIGASPGVQMPVPLRFWQSLTLNSRGRVATTFFGPQWQTLFDFTVLNGAADSSAILEQKVTFR